MSPVPFRLLVPALGLVLLIGGCSQQGGHASDAAKPAAQASADAAAAQDLDTYRQLVRIHNDEMATTFGEKIVHDYPDSAAAKEVQQTLPEISKRYHENAEKSRLAALWLYQVSPMSGGTQSTAVIYTSKPVGADKVRLVLRRHTQWGQNAFLFGSGKGFVCKGTCTLPAKVDGKAMGIKAFAPPSGEPALMIKDDKAFIALLEKAQKITLTVTPRDDGKSEELVYEVGGFDPAKWLPLPKGRK
ncbi:hypothetical protein [Dyella sp.]|uniref:hypothetical protein n=1 Tax=Dyella sp. TaxID=1869338 RepID=UPI002D76CEBB|nr:hypothetical protein [Dyella sp.]HET6431873.1 hypothetical protein [Dyella sp.]